MIIAATQPASAHCMPKRRGIDFSKAVRGFPHGPIKIRCAATTAIQRHEDLVRELFSEILEMSYDDCLVTDESEIDFFITEESPNDLDERFRTRYGFDLEEIESGNVEILERIAQDRT